MSWYDNVFELIDLRSFSNLWYWLSLAVMWSTVSHRVLGVPYDMVVRAQRHPAMQPDLEALARIHVNRLVHIGSVAGAWLAGLAAAGLTALAVLGFWYGIEFGQALFLMLAPLTLVGALGLRAARIIQTRGISGAALRAQLRRQRLATQVIGLFAILVTSMWGMWQNMSIGVLGG